MILLFLIAPYFSKLWHFIADSNSHVCLCTQAIYRFCSGWKKSNKFRFAQLSCLEYDLPGKQVVFKKSWKHIYWTTPIMFQSFAFKLHFKKMFVQNLISLYFNILSFGILFKLRKNGKILLFISFKFFYFKISIKWLGYYFQRFIISISFLYIIKG